MSGFLRTNGILIEDENGAEVLLQGYGIGNWLDLEGFIMGSSEFSTEMQPFMRGKLMERGRTIEPVVQELCGKKYAEKFWNTWYHDYFSREDIKYLADQGFNSVRLVLNARLFLEEEPGYIWNEKMFQLLDERLKWCEELGMYAILDLHAAVAGQSDLGCDDSVDNQPHLFFDEEGWERTIVLWEKLAERYKNHTIVAGYELLNEPLSIPWFDAYLDKLKDFYDECILRIRRIDRNHIIFLQGHRFAGRYEIFDHDYDPQCHNWVITAHCYESLPDLGLLGPILKAREEWNVPVWMGETGGYSSWMTVFYEMLREYHIGMNVWAQKAVSGCDAAQVLEFELPKSWQLVMDYAHKGGCKPSYEKAIAIFDEFLENIRFENCRKLDDRCNAILRKGKVSVPAIGYDVLPGPGKSFQGSYPYCCYCGYRREDHMHIVEESGYVPYEKGWLAFLGKPAEKYGDWPHLQLQLDEGDFASYRIHETEDGAKVAISYCTPGEGCEIEVWQDENLVQTVRLQPSKELREVSVGNLVSRKESAIRIKVINGTTIIGTVGFFTTLC